MGLCLAEQWSVASRKRSAPVGFPGPLKGNLHCLLD